MTRYLTIIVLLVLMMQFSCSADRSEQVNNLDQSMQGMIAVHSHYCPACIKMKPLLTDIKKRCDSDEFSVRIVDVDGESDEAFLEKYHVSALPTYLFVNEKGVETVRLVGVQTEQELVRAMSSLNVARCGYYDTVNMLLPDRKGYADGRLENAAL